MGTYNKQHRNTAKIISRIIGGIGNQLFCYAAARRLALVNHAELALDDVSGFVRDIYHRAYQLDHFNIPCRKATPVERMEPFSRIRRYVMRNYHYRLPFESRSFIKQEGVDFDPRLLSYKTCGTVYLEGNWQSEDYFKDVEATIRQDLLIRPPTDSINLSMAELIHSHIAVAVHVRFFDELQDEAGVNNTPSEYYTRAIAEMERRVPNAHYYIFSDQPEVARRRILLPDDRLTCVAHNQGDENAYADLWLMTQCQHFIIANSTFSWWGAWLAAHTAKVVIVPGFEMRQGKMSWGFKGLLPSEWNQIC